MRKFHALISLLAQQNAEKVVMSQNLFNEFIEELKEKLPELKNQEQNPTEIQIHTPDGLIYVILDQLCSQDYDLLSVMYKRQKKIDWDKKFFDDNGDPTKWN